tara:strand:+ start:661 stop:765 length:105 start_codon:yes stop_codon:yes gene_type:complete
MYVILKNREESIPLWHRVWFIQDVTATVKTVLKI